MPVYQQFSDQRHAIDGIVRNALSTVTNTCLTTNPRAQDSFDGIHVTHVQIGDNVIEAKFHITHRLTSESTKVDNPSVTIRLEFVDIFQLTLAAIYDYFEAQIRAMFAFRIKLAETIIS